MAMIHVVIPVYNAVKFLQEAVDSVLNQPFKGIDIVLVDDGSTDGSPALCDSIAAKEERVHVIHQKNGGVSAARNTGIAFFLERYPDEDYIAFLDADDCWAQASITENVIVHTESKDVVVFPCYFANNAITRLRLVPLSVLGPVENPAECTFWDVLVYVWNKFFKISFLRESNLRFICGVFCGEDTCFVGAALYHAKSLVGLDTPVLCYRKHSASVTNRLGNKNVEPWLVQIQGLIDCLDLFDIKELCYRIRIIDYCCWWFLEMSEAYYQKLRIDNKPYDILQSHPLRDRFENQNIGLSQREKRRISFMMNHRIRFKMKFFLKGMICGLKKTVQRIPIVSRIYEMHFYPLTYSK